MCGNCNAGQGSVSPFTACIDCLPDTYNPTAGQACQDCPPGSTTDSVSGSIANTACGKLFFLLGLNKTSFIDLA